MVDTQIKIERLQTEDIPDEYPNSTISEKGIKNLERINRKVEIIMKEESIDFFKALDKVRKQMRKEKKDDNNPRVRQGQYPQYEDLQDDD